MHEAEADTKCEGRAPAGAAQVLQCALDVAFFEKTATVFDQAARLGELLLLPDDYTIAVCAENALILSCFGLDSVGWLAQN